MTLKKPILSLSLILTISFAMAQESPLNYSYYKTLELNTPSSQLSYVGVNGNYFNSTYSQIDPSFPRAGSKLENYDFQDVTQRLNMEYPFKKRRHPMEKTGRILTYIGVPLAIIGGIMVAGADELYYECVNGNCSGDARGGFGVVMLGAGAGLAGTGAVLWIIGSKK